MVRGSRDVGGEEHQVAGEQFIPRGVRPGVPLVVGDAGQRDADRVVRGLGQPRAVEPSVLCGRSRHRPTGTACRAWSARSRSPRRPAARRATVPTGAREALGQVRDRASRSSGSRRTAGTPCALITAYGARRCTRPACCRWCRRARSLTSRASSQSYDAADGIASAGSQTSFLPSPFAVHAVGGPGAGDELCYALRLARTRWATGSSRSPGTAGRPAPGGIVPGRGAPLLHQALVGGGYRARWRV